MKHMLAVRSEKWTLKQVQGDGVLVTKVVRLTGTKVERNGELGLQHSQKLYRHKKMCTSARREMRCHSLKRHKVNAHGGHTMTHGNTVKLLAVTLAAGLVPLSGAQAKYANQEVSYVKGAARPEPVTTEQIQSPRDAASGQANTANITITDIVISSATTQSNPPRQANMGDTATQEKGVRNTVGPEGPSGVSEANALWQLIDAAKQDGPTGIQSPRDPASGQATGSARQAQGNELPDILNSSSAAPKPDVQNAQTSGFTSAEGRSMSLERTANGQGAPAFFDAPKLDADSGLEFSKTAAGQPVTDNLGDTATHEVGHRTGQSGKFQDDVPSAPNGYLKIEGVDGESVVQSPSSSSTTAGKPRRNRNGARGKRMHKPVG